MSASFNNAKPKGALSATKNSIGGFDTWLMQANLKHLGTLQIGGTAKSTESRTLETAKQRNSRLLLHHRLHEPRRVIAKLAHRLVVIGLLDGDPLQPVLRQPQQPRAWIGHQDRRMRGHDDLAM